MKVDGWWVAIGVAAAAFLGVFAYQNLSSDAYDMPGVKARPDRVRACGALTDPDSMVRLEACLAELDEPSLSAEARGTLQEILYSGDLLSAGPALPLSGQHTLLASREDLRKVLMGTDEEAAAAALREAGFRGVAVHRDLVGALDRDKRVLSRLAQHDYLEFFQHRRVTDELLIYTVRRSSSRVPLATGTNLVKGLRARRRVARPSPASSGSPTASG